MNWLKRTMQSRKDAKELYEQVKSQNLRIQSLMLEHKSLSNWTHQYSSVLGLLSESMQALIWKKDKNHKYLLANPLHCQSFFGFDGTPECLSFVVGKNDTELIKDIFRENGIQNTFGEMCTISDEHVSITPGEPVNYLEAGVVDGIEVLLYIIKTPQFSDSGEFVGSVGIGWDLTSQADFLVKQLNRWIYDGKAQKLYHNEKVFCYTIKPEAKKCQIFNHICPAPERDDCEPTCRQCDDVTFIDRRKK
jgi:hypothetical protein